MSGIPAAFMFGCRIVGDPELRQVSRVEALSACFAAQLWPYLDSAVSDRGKERLDKALKERRARWMLDVAVEQ
jgi:hypothetical protein